MNNNNDKIRIIPLGGVQEIGMNMTVIEYGNELLIVDCGVMFPRYHMLGIDYVIPDTSYLEDKNIIGLILTHGHEDHIGAIPHFLRKFPDIPIYGSRLTLAFLRAKLNDYKNEYKDTKLYEVEPRNKIQLGMNFDIEFIRVNHSIPDGVGIAITTPLGVIIHTGDFKIDLNPTTDKFIDLYKFAEYGENGVLLMLADSTNCQRDGFSMSESVVQNNMTPLFAYEDGMIIVAVFASSIERIQDLVTAAKVNNKFVAFSGRSLIKFTKIAQDMGYLNLYDIVIPIDKINKYPREKIVCITTGTQGEPYSSLSLIAAEAHKHIKVEDGDMVIFSSSVIPGNEMAVTRMINNLFDLGAKMVGEDKKLLHVSGHASSEDLKLMYRLVKPKYFIPIHGEKRHLITHIKLVENLNGLDKVSAGRTSGNGFYYLIGDIARLHSAMLAYARDFMINKGFVYAIPPFMIRSDVVTGVMSFEEMDAMMYKIEGEDLYLIGTSEHSMIGKFKDQIIKEEDLPIAMTSYSPCFRKEVGAHGIEERGLYRVHQFEKEEMIVLCKEEEGMDWYNKMWSYTVEFFRSLDIPVRTLECCSGDLADLKVKSCDVEAFSPRQNKYFEVGSCSILGDAQARRLGIRMKTSEGNKYVTTLNNTVLATPRGLIAFLENNYQEDGSVKIPAALRPYMGGAEVIKPNSQK